MTEISCENLITDSYDSDCADSEVSMIDYSKNDSSVEEYIENIDSFISIDSPINYLTKLLPPLPSSNKIDSSEKNNFIKLQNIDKTTSNTSLEVIFHEKSEEAKNSTRANSVPAVDKCGTVLLSISQISQLQNCVIFNQDMPYLTLSMAKKLTVAALSGSMSTILKEIDNINYYLKTSWRAFKSHRKKKISNLKSHLNLESSHG